ncbi:hypothetical protein EB001_17940 [bacterium]|nr:hypothetical protein [bacterium]
MATEIYKTLDIFLADNSVVEISPLKIKYLRKLMSSFENVKNAKGDLAAIAALTECARICMQQFKPEISTSIEVLEEYVDLDTIYDILDIGAGIKMKKDSSESVKDQATKGGSSWDDLDIAKLESEVFLLGIWKNYEELEKSISLPELMALLSQKRESDYDNKKFFAAIQGIDLDKNVKKNNEWEDLKARVFSKGQAKDSSDILALQGVNAQQAGFGIGLGLDYEQVKG